jgi:WD40 repeat protein
MDQTHAEPDNTGFQYDGFLSYSTRSDYKHARKVEAFLESFHKSFSSSDVTVRQMQICRDGSDFKLPPHAQLGPAEQDPIWEIIVGELAKAQYLIVLCSPDSTKSNWVSKEISWMLDHRGTGYILPVVTQGHNPAEKPETCFPAQIISAGLHQARLWYDLRSWGTITKAEKIRDAEDELVRLSSDLLGWDAAKNGPLAPLWVRDQLKKRRRQAGLAIVIAAALVVAASLVIWRSIVASHAASRARANAIVLAAESSLDPLLGVLLLSELLAYDEPEDGTAVARGLVNANIPITVLRGHTGQLSKVAFSPNQTRILTTSTDGTTRLWPVDGRGDPVVLRGAKDELVDARFNSDGKMIATALKNKTAKVWNEQGVELGTYEHDSSVVSAEFSFDDKWLATVSESGSGQLRQLGGTEKRILTLPNELMVTRLWLSHSSLSGWLGAANGSIWEFSYDGQGSLTLKQALGSAVEANEDFPSDHITNTTFSPDGSHVAISFNKGILVRNIQSKAVVVLAHPAMVRAVDFNSV